MCRQDAKLTDKERRELEYKKQVYELAKLRKAQQEALDNRDEYHMPAGDNQGKDHSNRFDLLTARYRCVLYKLAAPEASSVLQGNWR